MERNYELEKQFREYFEEHLLDEQEKILVEMDILPDIDFEDDILSV